jgi:hypothetical protein
MVAFPDRGARRGGPGGNRQEVLPRLEAGQQAAVYRKELRFTGQWVLVSEALLNRPK